MSMWKDFFSEVDQTSRTLRQTHFLEPFVHLLEPGRVRSFVSRSFDKIVLVRGLFPSTNAAQTLSKAAAGIVCSKTLIMVALRRSSPLSLEFGQTLPKVLQQKGGSKDRS
ncbi:hypothetical protein IV203_027362 [Nitzschia inconspicua]|uniref:Uncharacterized protein n=1 Tax=Nitzschia inconspicua TaxID=303405 RepID=A0A9K3LZS7_9STRA|nr:hypothetical protein IV203_027362 [Nitzschia inconspicua]